MIHIMTSNIRFDNPGDGHNAWANRKDFLTKTLIQRNPCIIGTQEGREPQLRELHGLLKDMTFVDSHRDWIEERMYPCLFIHPKFEIEKSGDFWLSETPDIAGSKSFNSMFPRLCVWAKLVYQEMSFFVFNMHLDHTEDSVRVKQAEVVISQVQKINKDGLPFIIMGDFNSAPYSVVYKKLTDKLALIDPWVSKGLPEESSFHQFKGSFNEGSRIDWILHSDHFDHHSIELIKDHDEGRYPSDHFPFSCVLK